MRPKSWDNSATRSADRDTALSLFAIIFGLALIGTNVWWLWPAPKQQAPEALMTNSEWPAVTYYRLRNVRVVDGDTLEADIDLPMRVTLRQEMIRCVDYDAWEANKRRRSVNVTDEEVVKGKAATEALKDLIESGRLLVQLEEDDRDVYGRVLARLFIAKNNTLLSVADWMTTEGHTRTQEK